MQWNIGCAMKWDENGMHVIGNENEYEYDMIWMCMKCQQMRNEMRYALWNDKMVCHMWLWIKRKEKWNVWKEMRNAMEYWLCNEMKWNGMHVIEKCEWI